MAVMHPESETKIAAMFDRLAPRYDLLNRLLSARQDVRWRKRLAALVPFRPQGRYLDVATGTGDVLLEVAAQHSEYRVLLGVDISKEMLANAKPKLKAAKCNADLRQMSAETLDLADQSFDCASIAFGLRNVVNREKALQEFHRVLTPGGVLLILEFYLPQKGLLASAFQLYFHWVLPLIGGLISDKEAYKYLPNSVGSFYSPEGMREALYKNGFNVTTTETYLFGACQLVAATRR